MKLLQGGGIVSYSFLQHEVFTCPGESLQNQRLYQRQ